MNTRRRRQSGAALVTALMVSTGTALLLGASLAVAMTSTGLAWNQVYAQAALQLADAGVNSELQYIALNTGQTNVSLKASLPVVNAGVTVSLPGTSGYVKGRPGTVTGYSGGNYYVYSSNDSAGTTAWDGATTPYYITSSACVNGCWQTVQVKAANASLFNVYGIFATGSDSSSPTSVTVGSNASVTITGTAGCNGGVSCGNHSHCTAPCAINCNKGSCTQTQFTSSNVNTGGQLCSVTPPMVYPKTSDCCRSCFGCPSGTSDASAYATCKSQSCNSSCVYQYNSWTNDSTINTSNCCKLSGGCGNQLTTSCFQNCNIKPGTYTSNGWWWWSGPTTAVQTLIFEPGDYYFTNVQLAYSASCEMVIDPCAYASGGTPGQVRFWLYDPNSSTDGNPADYVQLPIKNTCAAGTSTPDPGQFRIYNGKDGCSCTFTKPSNCQDWQGNTINSDFNYYCGIYACTKPANDTSSSKGCTTGFCGTNSSNTGCCNLCGSMLCDKLTFSGCCNANYTQSQTCTKDPCSGGTVLSWSCQGG